jgi:crossover junction endodeoxyribonuclease RusA
MRLATPTLTTPRAVSGSSSQSRPQAVELDFSAIPPSANRIWRRSGSRIHKSCAYTDWLRTAGWEAKSQHPGSVSGPYKLTLQAVRPDRRRRDLDNLIKGTSDLLTSIGVIDDDSQCEMISARWVTSGAPLHVRVEAAGVEAP